LSDQESSASDRSRGRDQGGASDEGNDRGTGPRIEVSPPSFAIDPDVSLHIVLVHPEIPQNSGNIARLSAGTGAWLHLVKPLGYKLEDRYIRRAGLDYWPSVRLSVHESLGALEEILPEDRVYVFSTRGSHVYTEIVYPEGAVLVFGCETRGLDHAFVERWSSRSLRIPITSAVRSLNLANCVSVATYEVLRQRGWPGLSGA